MAVSNCKKGAKALFFFGVAILIFARRSMVNRVGPTVSGKTFIKLPCRVEG